MGEETLLQLPLRKRVQKVRKSKLYGSRRIWAAMSDPGGGRVRWKLVKAFPSLACSPDEIIWTRTFWLQPFSSAARRYHWRVPGP